jgi:hypothetical protein
VMGERTALEKVRDRIEEIHARQVRRRIAPPELGVPIAQSYYARCRAAGFATCVSRDVLEREEARLRKRAGNR